MRALARYSYVAWSLIVIVAAGCGGSKPRTPAPGNRLLEKANGRLSGVCKELRTELATTRASWPVICPEALPRGELRKATLFPLGAAGDFRAGYGIDALSGSASDAASQGGHWTFAVGKREALQKFIFVRYSVPGEARDHVLQPPHRRTKLCGQQVQTYLMPGENSVPGMYAGHVVVEWTVGPTTFHVTVHGGAPKRELALALAASIINGLSRGTAQRENC